jgi:hypothetical protein
MGLLSQQRCPELSSSERIAFFSLPWLLPTLDPQLIDGCPRMSWHVFVDAVFECRVPSFVHVVLWMLMLASVGATLLFGSVRRRCECEWLCALRGLGPLSVCFGF